MTLTRNYEGSTALERLRFVLDHWQDIFSASLSSSAPSAGRSAPGSRRPGNLPRLAADHSVRKVEAALTVLADQEPVLARHLKAFRCNAEWRTRDTDNWALVVDESRQPTLTKQRVRERVTPDWISPLKVVRAEKLLLKLLGGDVNIPSDLLGERL